MTEAIREEIKKISSLLGFKVVQNSKIELKTTQTTLDYLEKNPTKITKILQILFEGEETNKDVQLIGCGFFLGICTVLNTYPYIKQKFQEQGIYDLWKSLVLKSFKVKSKTIGLLRYTRNSCYQDSVLMSLFASPSRTIKEYIFDRDLSQISRGKQKWLKCDNDPSVDYKKRMKVRHELFEIYKSIHSGEQAEKTCANLRRAISDCPGSQNFQSFETQDAGEFLQYLFSIFQVEVMVRKKQIFFTNNLGKNPDINVSNSSIEMAAPIIPISFSELSQNKSLKDYIEIKEDSVFDDDNLYLHRDSGRKFKRRIELVSVVKTPILIFYLQRLGLGNQRDFTPIKFQETIMGLRLHAIIVHVDAHYTAYLRIGDQWYYYDDIKDVLSPVDLEHARPSPAIFGTLFFYA